MANENIWDKTWVGIGVKSGGMLVFGGVESVGGKFFNVGNTNIQYRYSITSSRWGLGLGGGGCLSVILVFNLNGFYWLNGKRVDDWGINISMGEKWKDVATGMRAVKLIGPNLTHLVSHIDDIRNMVSYLYNALDVANSSDEHPIYSWDIPFAGVGLELSAYKTSGTIYIDDGD